MGEYPPFAGIYGMPEAEIAPRTDELFQRLGLEKERNTLVKSLPLGWKQKLAFSVSIFHHPRIVFLMNLQGVSILPLAASFGN